mgnify:CR=1 FL=1
MVIYMQREDVVASKYIDSIVETIPGMIFKLNKNGDHTDIISYKDKFLYQKKEELLNKNIKDIFNKTLSRKFLNKISTSLKRNKIETIEYKLKVPAGKKWFKAQMKPFTKNEVIVLIKEITEKKEKENIIKDYVVKSEMKEMELEYLYYKLDRQIKKADEIHKRTLNYNDLKIKNYDFESYYLPAENLGGDFYDIIKKDNKVILYVSDVTGHGLEAAVMSSFIKSTINSYVEAVNIDKIDPANIGRFLAEQFLKENYPDDYFICTIIMVLDINTDELKYLNLGIQDPILLYRNNRSQKIKKLINKGLPISSAFSIDILDFETDKLYLEEGDTIIFNTDGITEERVNGEYFINKYEKSFLNKANFPPAVISKSIKKEFSKFTNNISDIKDDITYIIFQKNKQKSKKCYFEIDSNKKAVREFHKKIQKFLGQNNKKDMFTMGLHELVVNAMEHGNKASKKKKINVELLINENYIYAIVKDEGLGFNWKEKISNDFNLEKNNDRGRGIMMTLAGCDEFFYNKVGNKAYLMKKL